MKGIILAGGQGTRLYPSTEIISKQLLPVFDKPMIYYALSVLMLAGIRDIAIISTPRDIPFFKGLLGTGDTLGVKLYYLIQPEPKGIAQSLILAEDFLAGEPCALILGDNFFYGDNLPALLQTTVQNFNHGAQLWAYKVRDASRYGVATFDASGAVIALEEKPKQPTSPWAVTGLYFYDHKAPSLARTLKPSARGELEITDLNQLYLNAGELRVQQWGRGMTWLDLGTSESLFEASQYVQILEARQGAKIACLEEIAYRMGYISYALLKELAERAPRSAYGEYMRMVCLEVSECGASV